MRGIKKGSLMKSPRAVVALAVVIIAISLCGSIGVTAELVGAIETCRRTGQPVTSLMNIRVDLLGLFPGLASIFGLLGGGGLFGMRRWARRIVLYLAIIPMSVFGFLVLVRPASVFPPEPNGALLVVGDLAYPMCVAFLVVSVIMSVWSLMLLTRDDIQSQFR